ncbi:MAG: hypothetical protein NUV77_09910 [Thermoguttaceae bacterium]|jgi:hypothetical protein|nr:hypothetical protein [Thermoguttaceae bacterium]
MNQRNNQVRCTLVTGQMAAKVLDLLRGRLADKEKLPLAVWCEPVPGRAPVEGFVGLSTGENTAAMLASSSPSLGEARLFFGQGMLHLLANGAEVRWAAWWEGEAIPKWCPTNGTQPQTADMVRRQRPVFLAGDTVGRPRKAHRGLRGASGLGEAVTLVEYFQGTNLRWWRLEPHDVQ